MYEVRCTYPNCIFKEHTGTLESASAYGSYHAKTSGHPGRYIETERMGQ